MEAAMIRDSFAVLLVEDEALSRNLLKNRLRELPNVTVTSLPNGLVAKEYLLEHVVDLVITDIRMPFMDGLELAAFVNRFCPETSTVIISGFSEFEYAKKAIQYGVKDYILKPVQMQHLCAVVEQCKDEVNRNRVMLLKNCYNEQEDLEELLAQLQRGKDLDEGVEELEKLISGGAALVSIGLPEEEKGKKELGSQCYKNLLGGMLHGRMVLSLGQQRSEYRYLILKGQGECQRSLKAVPEYLDRVLMTRVQFTEITSVNSLRELMELMLSSMEVSGSVVVERACQFMREHLGEHISRDMVADHVFLSSSHFGHLFKQIKGIGYSAYLTQMRIDQAKKLLRKNMMVSDVAAAVGYRDARYFSEIFYQKTGCYPSDYKYLALNGETAQDEEL